MPEDLVPGEHLLPDGLQMLPSQGVLTWQGGWDRGRARDIGKERNIFVSRYLYLSICYLPIKRKLSCALHWKSTNPIWRVLPSWPNYLSKAPFRIGDSVYEFRGRQTFRSKPSPMNSLAKPPRAALRITVVWLEQAKGFNASLRRQEGFWGSGSFFPAPKPPKMPRLPKKRYVTWNLSQG